MPLRKCSLAAPIRTLPRLSLLMDFAWNIILNIPPNVGGRSTKHTGSLGGQDSTNNEKLRRGRWAVADHRLALGLPLLLRLSLRYRFLLGLLLRERRESLESDPEDESDELPESESESLSESESESEPDDDADLELALICQR